jgi:hypothetical protein
MAEYTGKNTYVKFGSTVLSTRYRSFEQNEEVGLVDHSAGADVPRTYLTTLEDGTATLETLAEAAGTALWNAVDKGTEGTLEFGPEGTASGKPKHTVNAIVKSRRRSHVFEDVVKINVEFQFSGVVVDSAY